MNDKIKILFVIPGCKHGGTNKSLLNLLQEISKDSSIEYSVFAMNHSGAYRDIFLKYNLLPEDVFVSSLLNNQFLLSLKGLLFFLLRNFYRLFKLFGFDISNYYYLPICKKLSNYGFDTAISYQEGDATTFTSKLKIKNKIAWIHSDYKSYIMLKGIGAKDEYNLYDSFKVIVCVSDYTLLSFLDVYSEFKPRTIRLYNILYVEEQTGISRSSFDNDTYFNIVSIGRFDPIKRFRLIPKIAANLKRHGLNFKWFVVGGGNSIEISNFKSEINRFKLLDTIIYLGELNNPYQILSQADLLVSLSLSEACPFVVNEALLLGVPVLTTNYGSAFEFVKNDVDGFITTIDNIDMKLIEIMTNKSVYTNIKTGAESFGWDNKLILNQFKSII